MLVFLSAVSHCTDITETLSEENSDTEEYSWDESVADDSTCPFARVFCISTASCFGFDVVVR